MRVARLERAVTGALVKRTTKIGATLAVATLIAAAPTAEATGPWDVQPLHLELGLYAGMLLPSPQHELYDIKTNVKWEKFKKNPFEFGGRIAFFPLSWLGLEGEFDYALAKTIHTGTKSNIWNAGGHLVFQLPYRFTPFLVAGGGFLGVNSNQLGKDIDPEFHWGLGLKFYITKNFGLRADGRHILSGRYVKYGKDPSHSFEVMVGLTFAFGRHSGVQDRDGDGVPDEVDLCPDVAGLPEDGCPDTDGDGISDAKDKCPDVAGVAPDGCPPDADGDGVPDAEDECPNVAGLVELKGCPDKDGDGVADQVDECPDVPGTLPNGCPDPDPDKDGILGEADLCPTEPGVPPHGCPDRDGDGIPDHLDKCPDQPETYNGYMDKDGCPDELPKDMKKFTGAIRGIRFRTGSHRILRRSFPTLNKAVAVLKKYPEMKIEIGGHTDSRGSASKNEKISLKRAQSVQDYFLENGIEPDRISVKGYGESAPVASNRTRSGRAKNRRIEFKLRQ